MKYALGEIPPHWQLFCQYHPFADGCRVDDRSYGTDEQLEYILTAIENGDEPDQKTVDRLSQNRSRKYRRHRRILEERFALPQFSVTPYDAAFASAAITDDVRWVQQNSSVDEWRCLWDLANGTSYRELADRRRLSVGTLKARIARCRQRLLLLALAA